MAFGFATNWGLTRFFSCEAFGVMRAMKERGTEGSIFLRLTALSGCYLLVNWRLLNWLRFLVFGLLFPGFPVEYFIT